MKVVTFGEILLRLASPGYNRLFQKNSFESTFCGSEANVAVSLANYGIETEFVTKLPMGDIGESVKKELNYFNVNTSFIKQSNERLGIYYLEKGASQRPSKVIYDREYSAVSKANLEDFNWEEIFKGVTWFHFTGITPALSKNLVDICVRACEVAKSKDIKISCDLNYRSKLWDRKEAQKTMEKLLPYVDVCIGNEEDAKNFFGIESNKSDVIAGKLNYESYEFVARKLIELFDFEYVAFTMRSSISANDNLWSGILYSELENKLYVSDEYEMHIVDRVGGGDSFAAGIIYGLLKNLDNQEILDFATAASCLKHSIEGDFNRVTLDEVYDLMNGNKSGRVKR